MGNIKINLSEFKHLKSDDKSTTLQHKAGHQITLAHKGLSKANQEALKALATSAATDDQHRESKDDMLAKGGKPKPSSQIETDSTATGVNMANKLKEQNPHGSVIVKEEKEQKRKPNGLPDFGKVNRMAEGGAAGKLGMARVFNPEASVPVMPTPSPTPVGPAMQLPPPLTEPQIATVNSMYNSMNPVVGSPAQYGLNGEAMRQVPVANREAEFANRQNEYNNDLSFLEAKPGSKEEAKALDTMANEPEKKAEGGKVAKFCAYCGGKAHGGECQDVEHYVDGGAVPSTDDLIKKAEYEAINDKYMQQRAEQEKEAQDTADRKAYEDKLAAANPTLLPDKPKEQAPVPTTAAPSTPVSDETSQQPTADKTPLPSLQDALSAAQPKVDDFGLSQQLKGIQQQGEATKQMAAEAQPLMEQRAAAAQKATDAFQSNLNELRAERQAHIKDIQEGHINPEQYWEGDAQGNGSHSRLMAGLGMLLAGFNTTGNPNAAVDFVNKQLDRSIQAQKANLESKQNLYKFNLEQFRNERDAADMTRLMQSDALQHQLEQLKNKYTGQFAQSEINKLQGALHQQYAPLEMQMGMRKAMMQLANDPNGQSPDAIEHMISSIEAVDPAKGKELRERFVPGVGLAKTVLPAAVREQMNSHAALDAAGRDLLNYSKTHSNLLPGTAEYNAGVTKALAFQQAIREGLLGTVFRESEKPLLEKFVNENPAGAFKAISTQPKLQAVLESNALHLNTLKNSYGIPTGQQQLQQTAPQQQPVKGKDGRMYIRQGGYMVPVK